MKLRERILYGKNKDFGNWFHQQCVYVRNNADGARKRFINNDVAVRIDEDNAQDLNDRIGIYIQALFVAYLVFSIASDKGDDFLVKHLKPLASVIHTVLGPATFDLYQQVVGHVSNNKVNPESAVAHALIDPLALPLDQESNALEQVYGFFEEVVDDRYIPVLEEAYSQNQEALRSMLSTFGHSS